jgi:hypothetical protein
LLCTTFRNNFKPAFYLIESLLFVCFFSGYAAERGLWPPRTTSLRDHTQRRATVGRNLWTSDQLVAETSTVLPYAIIVLPFCVVAGSINRKYFQFVCFVLGVLF